MAQMNFRVGDIQGNYQKIVQILNFARENAISLVIFPEMALPGYPIQDLIFDRDFFETQKRLIQRIAQEFPQLDIILGGFGIEEDPTHFPKYQNAAYFISNGHISQKITKRLIPTYDVFDEKRYFWSGSDFSPLKVGSVPVGVAICEDLWEQDYQINVAQELVKQGARLIIAINGSPFFIGKQQIRETLIKEKARTFEVPILYLNMVGGQDELVFDGRSFIVDKHDKIIFRAPFCKENLAIGHFNSESQQITMIPPKDFINETNEQLIPNYSVNNLFNFSNYPINPLFNKNQEIIDALVMNVQDYYNKTGVFDGVVVSLSGGVDSAFTIYIASLAFPVDKVTALLLPSKYSSESSVSDSIKLCDNLGIKYFIIPIKEAHQLLESQFDSIYNSLSESKTLDLARQNLQSRLRGVFVMYYSNLYNYLVLSTGNKSEIATGYCTLYGDTNGGKNIPGDLYKTQLYQVCKWINREQEIIPQNIITKPPSAELKPDQVDQDNLPPYPILDEILELRIDEGFSPREIIKKGYDASLVSHIEKLYTTAEFKRAQLAQTIKINKKTFGKGRKIPVLKRNTY